MMKILNPKTNRLVLINKDTAKGLYKQHLEGKITLKEDDVKLLKIQYPKMEAPKPKTPSPNPKRIQSTLLKTYKLSDFDDIKTVSTPGTSKIFNATLKETKETYYIKEVIKHLPHSKTDKNMHGISSIELAINEILASIIYRHIYKVAAIDLALVINDTKTAGFQRYMVASKALLIDTCEPITQDCKDLVANKIKGAIEPILVDCVLANWDVGSRGNVGIIAKTAFRIDVGGALLFRALGAERKFARVPTEHQTFFLPTNKGYSLFRHITPKQAKEAYNILERVNPSKDFTMLHKQLEREIERDLIIKQDKANAINIISCIFVVQERHEYYIKNKPSILQELSMKNRHH